MGYKAIEGPKSLKFRIFEVLKFCRSSKKVLLIWYNFTTGPVMGLADQTGFVGVFYQPHGVIHADFLHDIHPVVPDRIFT